MHKRYASPNPPTAVTTEMPSSFRREAQHQTRGGEWTLNMTSALLATMVALLLSSVTVEGRQVALPGPQCHPSGMATSTPFLQFTYNYLELFSVLHRQYI